MSKQISAVEWLAEVVAEMGYVSIEILEQAKEMERREKAEEYIKGFKDGSNHIKITYNL